MKPIYLYVVPFFPSKESWRGGFFMDAVKAMMRDGRYEVIVMSATDGKDYEIDGIRVYRFLPFRIGDSDYFSTLTDRIKLRRFSRKLASIGIRLCDVAVCHAHLLERVAIYPAWIKRMNPRCLTIVHHHLSGNFCKWGDWLGNIIPFLQEWAYLRIWLSFKKVDVHVFCSELTRDLFGMCYPNGLIGCGIEGRLLLRFARFLKPLKYREARICYNGIDTSVFSPVKKQNRKDGVFRIGCVANFVRSKSQITLIQAAEKLISQIPNLEVSLVGSGQCLQECRDYVVSHGMETVVDFVAEMDHLKMPDYYRSLDLYVLPSYREAFNCSLIEALGCGVPIITTDVISMKEVLSEEARNRCLFKALDSGALAKKILDFYHGEGMGPIVPNRNLNIDNVIGEFLDWTIDKRSELTK